MLHSLGNGRAWKQAKAEFVAKKAKAELDRAVYMDPTM